MLIFLIFFENRFYTYNKSVIIFLSSISMILCMVFPIKLEFGPIFDLRYIPFLLIALFWGYRYTFPLYIVLNMCRFLIGGPYFLHSFVFSTVIYIFVSLLNKVFMKQSPKKRIFIAAIISLFTMVLYLSSVTLIIPALDKGFWLLAFYALTTYAAVMVINMVLIEKIIDNAKTREYRLHSERLNVMSDLSASVSHEIRNPLTVTKGFLQLLKDSQNITGDEKRYVEISLSELKRAEQIVTDFLAFSKPQSENMVVSNLKEEIDYVTNVMIPYANMHQVDVEMSFNNTLKIMYDKNQAQQCLINLFKNAIEAMRENGGILSIDVSEQGNQIVVKIKDTGIGMTKEEVLRLGRPYYSTKKEGTGLGMLMVYSTVDKVNGKIEVESEKGIGTTFLITIPSLQF
ncbi:HAMP domain-containing sensor histidine kinase [Neobacillus terrae]|uniref:HAMP domain-containing sensor histidine kinase n=1 Tax=Neobacillus terrae TaxID=3034837 RepID=UPI003082EC59